MKRNEWSFSYPADVLLDAATLKREHHSGREKWWQDKKAGVMSTIRSEGIEIDESLAAEGGKFASNYARGPQVSVRNDLLRDLDECTKKVKEHHDKALGYESWIQILASQGKTMFPLQQDDWLYFFGK